LMNEKVANNAAMYKATAAQTQIIFEIFQERDQMWLDNQKFIDRAATLSANVGRILRTHLDHTDTKIAKWLQERLGQLQQLLAAAMELHQSYTQEVIVKLSNWLNALENLAPDLERMSTLQRANYWLSTDNVSNAMSVLEANWEENAADFRYIEALLQCYRKAGKIEEYKQAVLANRLILETVIPDFNRLNAFLKETSESLFLIEVYDAEGNKANGSGFAVGEHLIATNRHVVEGGVRILVIGRDHVWSPTQVAMDTQNDIALLTIETPLKKLRMGVSEFVEPGEKVIAIGFPNVRSSVFAENVYISHGVVNSIRKHEVATERVIFIDTKISSGMSGGPILNDVGEVVGMITLVQYHLRNHESGFARQENQPVALPIRLVSDFIQQIKR
jgi:S1-C subfamily serine protease